MTRTTSVRAEIQKNTENVFDLTVQYYSQRFAIKICDNVQIGFGVFQFLF